MAESKNAQTPAAPIEGPAPIPVCEMAELLQDAPLHSPRQILRLFSQPEYANLVFPDDIRVHCDDENCDGVRRHSKYKDDKFQLNDHFFIALWFMAARTAGHV